MTVLLRNRLISRSSWMFIVALLLLGVPACTIQSITHSPRRAALDVNDFMKAVYVEEDYGKALQLGAEPLRQAATTDDLKKMVEALKQQRGKMLSLKGDSFLRTQGRSMELFYVGEHEKGPVYHRVVLLGDGTAGYKVSGLWFQLEPYPQHGLRAPLEDKIIVF